MGHDKGVVHGVGYHPVKALRHLASGGMGVRPRDWGRGGKKRGWGEGTSRAGVGGGRWAQARWGRDGRAHARRGMDGGRKSRGVMGWGTSRVGQGRAGQGRIGHGIRLQLRYASHEMHLAAQLRDMVSKAELSCCSKQDEY